MRIGINQLIPHKDPEDWAKTLSQKGYRASSFPATYKAPLALIDEYVAAAKAYDIQIAEVGVWNSPHHPDPEIKKQAREACLEQFRLAEYVGARCCVNVSGAAGGKWFFCYPENFTEELYEENVRFLQSLCDTVQPKHTCYALETMQWMLPWSVEQYEKIVRDVARPGFKVHMDICNLIYTPYDFTHQHELMDKAFATLGDQIVSCHIKDLSMKMATSVLIGEVQVGEGSVDHGYYFEKIASLDPETPALLEHMGDLANFDRALAHLKTAYPAYL